MEIFKELLARQRKVLEVYISNELPTHSAIPSDEFAIVMRILIPPVDILRISFLFMTQISVCHTIS